MKVVCIDNCGVDRQLTIGNLYTVNKEKQGEDGYYFIDGIGYNIYYKASRFKIHKNINKLKKLLK